MEEFWRTAPITLLAYAGHVLGAIVILVAGWLAMRILIGPFRRLLGRSHMDPSVASFLANSARTAVVVVVLLAVLQQLGVPMASLLTLVGAAGLAIALSLQGSLANFASGLLVLAFRMVRVGDLIELGDVRGRVTELLPFHTVVVTLDNQRVTLPNTLLTTSPLRNHSALPTRRVQWTLPLSVRDDLAAVQEALVAQVRADPRILAEPAPDAHVRDWSEEKRVLVLEAWTATADHLAVQQDVLEKLGLRLQEVRERSTPPSRSE
jgi:small conductance mechanosensitive channel